MPPVRITPAEQLRSVAVRYRAMGRSSDWPPRPSRALAIIQTAPLPRVAPKKAAAGPHVRSAELARVEVVLLLAREPLSSRRIAQLARLADGTQARTLIRRLGRIYDAEGTAFRVEEFAGGFQLLTRAKFGGWLRRLHSSSGESRLSAPALETLAVVAYRQPVVRAEIEAIRGVGCGEVLRQLMDRDLVKIAGRADELGRPFLYATTKRFLQVFSLRNLDELPRAKELRALPRPVLPVGANSDESPVVGSPEV